MPNVTTAPRALLLLIAGLVLIVAPALAQEPTAYVLQPESELTVEGKSNTGDWLVTATAITGGMTMQANASAAPGLQDVHITIPTEQIKAKNLLMRKNMRKTLKVATHKEIHYALKEVVDAAPSDEGANAFTFVTLGDLTIGGETREVEMTVLGTMLDNGQVHLAGSYSFKMSDYNLTERRFMFGQFVLADEVQVKYTAKFAPDVAGSQ